MKIIITIGHVLFHIVHFILIIAGAIFIGLHGYRLLTSQDISVTESLYKTTRIKRGDLESIVASTGTIKAVGTVEVGTQVSGTVKHVYVDYNDRVKKGQILAKLDTDLLEASVSEGEAGVIIADADFLQAQANYNRNKKLYAKKHITEQEFLSFKIELEKARAKKISSGATLDRTRINLKNAIILSPIDGTVIERAVSAGQTVAANLSAPVLFILAEDLSLMQIEVDVDESDIGQIEENQQVNFTVQTWPDAEFSGVVDMIRLNPETISNVVNYTVMVSTKNKENLLLPGMTATVDFVIQKREDVLLVDNAAIKFKPNPKMTGSKARKDNTRNRFFILDARGQLQMVMVKTGLSDGTLTEISGGDPLIVKEGAMAVVGINRSKSDSSVKRSLLPGPPQGGRGMKTMF